MRIGRKRMEEKERKERDERKTPTEYKMVCLLVPLWVITTSVQLDWEKAKNSQYDDTLYI